jgi:DNA-binding protein HU-beta
MTKSELIHKVYEVTRKKGYSKNALNEICDCIFHQLGSAIRRDKRFTYPGFGTWSVRKRKARKGRNPQTGQTITINASKTVGFRPSPNLKTNL